MDISSLGVGSGLDLESLVRQLVQAERAPREQAIRERQQDNQVQISAYSKLKGMLTDIQDKLSGLSDADALSARSVTFNNGSDGEEGNSYLSATASPSAASASYQVSVEQLAQGSKAKSAAFSSADEVMTTTAGTLTFATASGSESFDIAVDANATLSDVANAINNSSENFGVSASIINTGGTNPETRLVLTSSVTGAANELVVSNDNAELDQLSTQATGTGPAGMTIATEDSAQDAILDIDGIRSYSATNTFDNTIQGVSIDALKAAPGVEQTMSVGTDKTAVKDQINEFMEAYNTFVKEVSKLTENSPDGKSGALIGDSTIRGLMNSLQTTIGSAVGSADPAVSTLYSVGITFDQDGLLEFGTGGEERLDKVLENNFDSVSKLFTNADGIGTRLDQTLEQYTQAGGIISTREDVFEDRKENLTKEKEDFDRYMSSYEDTLRQQYAGLDSTLAQLNRTQQYLAGQLANLPGFGGGS